MTGETVVRRIGEERKEGQFFIRWWRREEDWLDLELIDSFIANAKPDEEIGGFSLLGMEEMWEYLHNLCSSRVARMQRDREEIIRWRKKSGEEVSCLYTPESLINIFDAETRGNYID